MENEFSISERLNDFIKSLPDNPNIISVRTIGNETIILYEDYTDHPPIINYPSRDKAYKLYLEKKREENEMKLNKPKSLEEQIKTSKYKKGKTTSIEHREILSLVKRKYHENLKFDASSGSLNT